MDRVDFLRKLAAFGFYGYSVERTADLLNMSARELKKLLAKDKEFADAFNNSIERIRGRVVTELMKSIEDRVVPVKRAIKVRRGKMEEVKEVYEDELIKGDVNAMKFLLINLDPENFSNDGRHNEIKQPPIVINVTPVVTDTSPEVTSHK